jgi:hypothetical protein
VVLADGQMVVSKNRRLIFIHLFLQVDLDRFARGFFIYLPDDKDYRQAAQGG